MLFQLLFYFLKKKKNELNGCLHHRLQPTIDSYLNVNSMLTQFHCDVISVSTHSIQRLKYVAQFSATNVLREEKKKMLSKEIRK